jgi:apolipoprotein D and lipocalin family protein
MLFRLHRRLSVLLLLTVTGCGVTQPEMKTVEYVDLDRFMGDWYVIANIPTFIEKNAYNAVESYEMNDDGSIDTTFTFNKGSFDGELKEYNPTGFVLNEETNARWGMRFIWPIKADYRIIYLSDDYRHTVIGRQKRDFLWIMSREPTRPHALYRDLVDFVVDLGYERSSIRKVPQQAAQ